MDEISSFEEYQDLIKALKIGAETIGEDPNRNAIYGIRHLSFVIASLNDSVPTGLFRVYHQHMDASPDHKDVPFIWDVEVEFNGQIVKLRLLIEKLEKLWDEYQMSNESGP